MKKVTAKEGAQDFRLTAQEFNFLRQLASEDELFNKLIPHEAREHSDKIAVRLDRAEAERLRGYLTKRLAAGGFDKDYSPTKEGRMLEALIDKFYLSK